MGVRKFMKNTFEAQVEESVVILFIEKNHYKFTAIFLSTEKIKIMSFERINECPQNSRISDIFFFTFFDKFW